MRYIDVAGVRISKIGLGTWQFGSREWGYGVEYASAEALRITHRALDLGINLLDTAEIYGFGSSERIVGRAITQQRQDAFIATKLFPILPIGPVIEWRAQKSARRLQVETIDLYQIHQPNALIPLEKQMAGMHEVMDRGLVRHVGVSNFSLERWKDAQIAFGGTVLSNQVRFSLVDRRPLYELLPWAITNDRLIIAYSPLAQGFLSGRYDETNAPRRGVRSMNPLFLGENLIKAKHLLLTLREVAIHRDATPAQIALAWIIKRPNVVAIPGASSVEQLERNAEAADLELSDDEDQELTASAEAFQPIVGQIALRKMVRERMRSRR